MDNSVPLSLIINELLTNSINYTFPEGIGCINISLEKEWYFYFRNKNNGIEIDLDQRVWFKFN